MLDEAQIRALLQDLPERAIRSGLDPYRELILELRRRRFSYRQIAKLLVERCGFDISHSAIHDFVRKHGATTTPLLKPSGSEEPPTAFAPRLNPERRGADPSIRERIDALKRQKPASEVEETAFRFDPAKPLHLED